MKSRLKTVSLIILFLVSLSPAVYAEDITEGYDENTEITLKGVITEVVWAKRGPVILAIDYKNKIFNIVTAPKWYLHRNNITFNSGAEVEVTGSKFLGRDGTFYISARRIRFIEDEKVIELRDSHCRPLWRRMH